MPPMTIGVHDVEPVPQSGFERLGLTFLRARVFIATVLLGLQLFVFSTTGPVLAAWLALACLVYLGLTLIGLWQVHTTSGGWRWLRTIGADALIFALLQYAQDGINYTPLFALPVLLVSILGSLRLGLTSAAGVVLLLLGEAWFDAGSLSSMSMPKVLQAVLSGTGFLFIAALSNQLAMRLARQETLARASQASARTQTLVNELIIRSLSQGILVVNAQGLIYNANPAAQTILLGHPPGQGSSPAMPERAQLGQHPQWASLYAQVQDTFLYGQPMQADISVPHPDQAAHRLYVRTRLTSAQDDHSERLCVLFLEDLREIEARVRTEKLASMGRLSAAVAHEIRNPLCAITQANALLDEDTQDPVQKQLTRIIEQNALRLDRIVQDILNAVRADPDPGGHPYTDTLALDETAAQIAREWAQQNQAQDQLLIQTNASHARVHFDPEHLRRVLVNLLDNAKRHATANAASLRLTTAYSGPARLQLAVWSDGPPIEASVHRHLFEPFFSSESRSSGLGLYLCRELCERHSAQIAYQRRPHGRQEGNEFYVSMPVVARQ